MLSPDEPDKARPEHGGCGIDESLAQRLDAAEVLLERRFDVVGAFLELQWFGSEAKEECMVIVCGTGEVEKSGVERVACESENDVFDILVLVGLAGRDAVEFVYEKFLVLRPCNLIARDGQQAWNALLCEEFIV